MPRVKLFTEEEVLQKAVEIFWIKGYHATSVQDLVGHLGINRASLYDTFGDKKALFNKAFAYYRKTSTAGIKSFIDSQSGIKEGFRMLFEKAIDESVLDNDRKGCFVVNTTTEFIPGDDEIHGVLEDNRISFEKMIYEFLLSGVENKEIKNGKDLKAISGLLFMLYNGLKVVSKIHADKKKLMSAMDEVLKLLD